MANKVDLKQKVKTIVVSRMPRARTVRIARCVAITTLILVVKKAETSTLCTTTLRMTNSRLGQGASSKKETKSFPLRIRCCSTTLSISTGRFGELQRQGAKLERRIMRQSFLSTEFFFAPYNSHRRDCALCSAAGPPPCFAPGDEPSLKRTNPLLPTDCTSCYHLLSLRGCAHTSS